MVQLASRGGRSVEDVTEFDDPALIDAALCGDTNSDREQAVAEGHRRWSPRPDGLGECHVLEIRRPVMHADMADSGIDDVLGVDLSPTIGPSPDTHDSLGDEGFDLPLGTDDGDLLFVPTRLSEHAEVEHRPRTAFVLDDHIGVVDDVGYLAVVPLVEVVDVLGATGHDPHRRATDEEVHQVEEVTAFLDEGSARVAVESVPISDLLQEREAMFADGDHVEFTHRSVSDLGDDALSRRHVPVFEAHPHHATGNLG